MGAGIGMKFDGPYPQGIHSLRKRRSIKFTASYSRVSVGSDSQLHRVLRAIHFSRKVRGEVVF